MKRIPRFDPRLAAGVSLAWAAVASAQAGGSPAQVVKPTTCAAVSFEGDVTAGQAFRKVFAPGLEFFIEPLPSGWIVRVLAVKDGHEVRGPHDWAEVATPPYRSPNPLLISTDWAFRAQDAGAWNPREFHYAGNQKAFARLSGLEDRVVVGNVPAESELLTAVMQQPTGSLELLDVKLVPGTRDQAKMAAAVASHWEQTPHEVTQGQAASALGKLMALRFRVTVELPAGVKGLPGETLERISCAVRPTA